MGMGGLRRASAARAQGNPSTARPTRRRRAPHGARQGIVLAMACDIATWCGETNPLFDRTRFLKACGITNEQGQRKKG